MRFEFATAVRIVFGAGAIAEIGTIAKGLGARALLVTGRSTSRAEPIVKRLETAGVSSASFPIVGEPTVAAVEAGVQHAKAERCDMVISLGGGSAMDAGKAIAAMLANPGELTDYLEVIGRGQSLSRAGVPFVAIPTTAGTGTEVTRNAVLGSPGHRFKVSLRSPLILARVALVDPELTYDLPPALTASTGLDALTQLIEPFVSIRANPMTDAVCVEGIRRAARSLRRAFEQSQDTAAREDMAVASLFGGLALANAGLGAVHGFAAPIGGMFPAPHGAVCAALLPHVMTANLRALRERGGGSDALRRYDEIARLVTGQASASANDGVMWVRELCDAVRIPPLHTWGVTEQDFPSLVEKAAQASSMKANPLPLTQEEMRAVLSAAL